MTKSVVLKNILSGGWKDLAFQPFKEGVEIYSIIEGEPALALLKYAQMHQSSATSTQILKPSACWKAAKAMILVLTQRAH